MYEIGKTFSQMAKFAQLSASGADYGANLCGREEMAPRTTKGAPIQGALQKTGADRSIKRSA
jgi:hypothetical protein